VSEQKEEYTTCQMPIEHGQCCSQGCHIMIGDSIQEFDYPAAARSIHLWLKDLCDESLAYPRMIADASRNAALEIERLRQLIERDRTGLADALANIQRTVDSYTWLLEGHGPYKWNDDAYRKEAGRALKTIAQIAYNALVESGNKVIEARRGNQ
jgi:hypothetical protein